MQIQNISKKKFNNLQPLDLSKRVLNTESMLYYLTDKDKWQVKQLVLKKLFNDEDEYFSNKLYTINELLFNRDQIDIEELVFPESLAAVNREIVGPIMPYIPNINFEDIIYNKNYPIKLKIEYLKQMGEIIEKVSKVRKHSTIRNFYLNDIHEGNFILNTETNRINYVDLDSCKINNNLNTCARYLTPFSPICLVSKYKQAPNPIGGYFKVDNNTEIYCYILIILNTFFGDKITKLSIEEFYEYLNYLNNLGISKNLLDIFSYIYSNRKNVNPYEYLDELEEFYGQTHKNVFNNVRTRKVS